MDNSNLQPRLLQQGFKEERTRNITKKPKTGLSILVSFFSAFLIILSATFMVNISTINTAEAKSKYSETKVKYKKHRKNKKYYKGKKRYKKSRKKYKKKYKKKRRKYKKKKKRYYKKRVKKVRSKKYRKGKKYRKARKGKKYRKSKKYSKRLKRSKRSKRSKYKKSRYSKKRYKRSKYKKARYSKKRSKRYKKKRRSRYITCDQLKSSVLRRKARKYQKTISHAARTYGVSQNMIKAVITVETCFRSGLRGTSGEKGLMQLMPATAKRFGVKNRFSTWQNIHGGARYLSYLLRQYKGNKPYAAAAYNGGMGAVSKRTGPKFRAVRVYSAKVMNAYRKFNPLTMVKSKKKRSKKRKKKL